MSIDGPQSEDPEQPDNWAEFDAARQHLIEAIQDFNRARDGLFVHPMLDSNDPSVLVGWVLVYDVTYPDSSRHLLHESSDALQEWNALGMLQYSAQMMQAETTVDTAMNHMMVMSTDDEDDGDDE